MVSVWGSVPCEVMCHVAQVRDDGAECRRYRAGIYSAWWSLVPQEVHTRDNWRLLLPFKLASNGKVQDHWLHEYSIKLTTIFHRKHIDASKIVAQNYKLMNHRNIHETISTANGCYTNRLSDGTNRMISITETESQHWENDGRNLYLHRTNHWILIRITTTQYS